MTRRWGKLEKDFKNKNGLFDISKVTLDLMARVSLDIKSFVGA